MAAFLLLGTAISPAEAQQIRQTIKGSVYDSETRTPLIGAAVVILGTDPLIGATTDLNGDFHIRNATLGRHAIHVTYLGYEPAVLPHVMVTSGREVVLNIGLSPSVSEMEEVTITPQARKDIPLNTMATNSARSFTVEETRRYAGGLDDPARLVSAFAGVTTGNLQDNAIIIRGNSPKGVSWRLEGVEIPTPHHFPAGNVAGGGVVTIFSNQLLADSDFFTSAFPAEYGNATAGVFDMRLRNGNFERREYTFQAGVLGFDFASEGPLVSDSRASYLFNYRYSTFGLLTDVNLIPTDQALRYQDLSFKINIPTGRAGTFSVWGIGGMDSMNQPQERDSTAWDTEWDRNTFEWDTRMGAVGLTHRFITGHRTWIESTVAATGIRNQMEVLRFDDDLTLRPELFAYDDSGNISIRTTLNHRFNRRHTFKAGAVWKQLRYNLDIGSTMDHVPETFRSTVGESGSSSSMQMFAQSRFALSEQLTLNAGLHTMYVAFNDAFVVDPRAGLRWSINRRHALSLGYGRHSQLEELRFYFTRIYTDGVPSTPNRDLKLTRAHHLVLGHDWNISSIYRIKVEGYYQWIDDAPGEPGSSYSLINFKQDWFFNKPLENNSVGRNYGVDVTLERFLNRNYYYLITGSLFDSRYRGDDGVWRNTRFNKRYVLNALAGREFFFRENSRVLGLNGRVTFAGGERVSPLHIEETIRERREIYDETRAFSDRFPSTFHADLTVTYRLNRRNYSSAWALQVKNIFGSPSYYGDYYSFKSDEIIMYKDVVIVPSLSYKVEF
ncbi:TonB-dependent receptor [Balneolales bacterium ANBcel1]|nr:TonB-dependent receptor [Balneolales bacterium ANBcel1]